MDISNLAHDTTQHTRIQVSRASSLAGIAANITQARALYRDDQEPTEHLSPQTLIDCDARPAVSLAAALSVSLSVNGSLPLTMERTWQEYQLLYLIKTLI